MDIDFGLIRQHVAISGSFTRNLNEKVYVKERLLVNYSKMKILPEGFGFKDVNYADNGKGVDLVQGDGIYISVDRFEITPKQAGNWVGASVPLSAPLVVVNTGDGCRWLIPGSEKKFPHFAGSTKNSVFLR